MVTNYCLHEKLQELNNLNVQEVLACVYDNHGYKLLLPPWKLIPYCIVDTSTKNLFCKVPEMWTLLVVPEVSTWKGSII